MSSFFLIFFTWFVCLQCLVSCSGVDPVNLPTLSCVPRTASFVIDSCVPSHDSLPCSGSPSLHQGPIFSVFSRAANSCCWEKTKTQNHRLFQKISKAFSWMEIWNNMSCHGNVLFHFLIDNKSVLVLLVAWHCTCDKSLHEQMLIKFGTLQHLVSDSVTYCSDPCNGC